MLLGAALIVWIVAPLEHVRLADGALPGSDYHRETRVPFAMIAEMAEHRWVTRQSACAIWPASSASVGEGSPHALAEVRQEVLDAPVTRGERRGVAPRLDRPWRPRSRAELHPAKARPAGRQPIG